ncbi:MAG: DUF3575 domain-containing protein [Chitinophagaceae bacterium]|nr:MAG: DUF3575 domain-containing protein [Chitinophagaceae bacterium]
MKFLYCVLSVFFSTLVFAQDESPLVSRAKPDYVESGFILKTNVLNVIAQRPNLSGEYFFNSRFSMEVAYVSGFFKPLFWVEKYNYKGLLVRAKFFQDWVEPGEVSKYFGVYAGTLRKSVYNVKKPLFADEHVLDFTRNSFRTGITIGAQMIGKKRLVLDAQTSLGLGSYFKYKPSPDGPAVGNYCDTQLWVSLGYLF